MLYNFGVFRGVILKVIFYTTLLITFCGSLKAQIPVNYTALHIDTIDSANVAYFKSLLSTEKDSSTLPNSKSRKFAVEQYTTRSELFQEYLSDEELLSHTKLDSLIQNIVSNILNANPELKGKVRVFVSRSLIPNAYSLGNSLVIFNIGMLSRLQNDAQVAFILCHEFAHQVLQHGNEAIYKSALKVGDRDFRRQVKSTLKQEYNVSKKLEELLLPGLLSDLKYSRTDELKADSLGFIYLSRTNYDLSASLSVMDVLDKLDEDNKVEPLDLKKFFTLPQVPVGKYWFEYKGASSLGMINVEEKTALDDSLKTHPDCKLRKDRLSGMIHDDAKKRILIANQNNFDEMILMSKGESVQYMFDTYNIGRSLFLAIRLLEERPTDVYPRSMVSLCMAYYSIHQANHSSGYYIDLPNPDYSEGYNRFLTFMQELNPKETAELSYWIVNPSNQQLKENEVYFIALTYSAFASGRKEEYKKLSEDYNSKFPKGRYTSVYKELIEN